jgi:CheY-like chemotaxis protein
LPNAPSIYRFFAIIVRINFELHMRESKVAMASKQKNILIIEDDIAFVKFISRVLTIKGHEMIKVLVVDDEHDNRSILSMLLEQLGSEIMQAEDGVEGEQMALDWQPHLILLDIMMPRQDGYKTCTNLRSRGYRGQIVLISSLSQGIAASQALNCGANAFFMKPITAEVLQGCMNKCAV